MKEKKKKKRRLLRYMFYDFVRVSGALTTLGYYRPKVLYENPAAKKRLRGKAVIVANHTGPLDAVILLCVFYYRRLGFLVAKEVFSNRMGNWFFRQAQCIPVDRENFSAETFNECMDVLERGKPLCIFPEGTINDDAENGGVAPFKSGAVYIAMRGKAPIIPVYIAKRTKWYKRAVCVIGEPIDVSSICQKPYDRAAIDKISAELHAKEMELSEIYFKWKNRKKKSPQ